MRTVLLEGLRDQDAADVRAAILEWTPVGLDDLGAVEVSGSRATIQVEGDRAARLAAGMDGRTVGSDTVRARVLDAEAREHEARVQAYLDRLRGLVDQDDPRMGEGLERAIGRLDTATGALARLRGLLAGASSELAGGRARIDAWRNNELGPDQRRAVRRALGAELARLVHGPPGTGTREALAEIVVQHVERGDRVLLSAPDGRTLDRLAAFLLDQGVHLVRVGEPTQPTTRLQSSVLSSLVPGVPAYQQAQRLREQVEQATGAPAPSGDPRDPDVADLLERAQRQERAASDQVLEEAEVVAATPSSAGSRTLEDHRFDLLVLAGASRVAEPVALAPITLARKIVLAGDHHRPGPATPERELEGGFEGGLFERLVRQRPELVDRLTVQRRMHETLMGFPSEAFYEGSLQAADRARSRTLADLGVRPSELPNHLSRVVEPKPVLVLVDTSSMGRTGEGGEDDPVSLSLARAALRAGLYAQEVAVIRPRSIQPERDTWDLDGGGVTVGPVEAFRGRTAELVIVALTDPAGGPSELLEDPRRLNVALTRAKRKLVLVGDAAELEADPMGRRLLEHVDATGRRVPLEGA